MRPATFAIKTYTLQVGTETLQITGGANFDQVELIQDDASNAAPTASFAGGKLTITFDGDGSNNANLGDIVTAINTGAPTAGFVLGTPSGTTTTIAGSHAFAAVDTTETTAGIKVTSSTTGADYNNVTVKYVAGASTGANYDADTQELTVTVATGGDTFANIKTAIDSEGFTASFLNAAGTTTASYSALKLNLADQTVVDASTGNTGGQLLKDDLVFELNGKDGSDVFNFQAGATARQIRDAINLVKDATGVEATEDASELTFQSTAYGSDAKVAINILSEGAAGGFKAGLSGQRATGTDIEATINGVRASAKGNTLSINTATLDLSLTVSDGDDTSFSFDITGGGALFQLGGDVVSNQQARLGIGSVSTGQLGGASGRLYELGSGQGKSLTTDVTGAAKIIDEVINKVTTLRGRLGAFQRTTLESNSASLSETLNNLNDAQSSIRDADFAKESANLTRAQILVQSGTQVLQLANSAPQNVLSLLR